MIVLCDFSTLDTLKDNETARVLKIETDSDIKRRLWDLGLIENAKITRIGTSPLGDPVAFIVKNTVIALRLINCKQITVEKGVLT